jgi:glycerol-3-phosphate dehydrogenase (NAD(P)+)
MSRRVAVLGAGNWGTTLAHLAAKNGHSVLLWSRAPSQCDEINGRRTNDAFAPGLAIAPGVRALTSLRDVLEGAELVLFVVPSQAFREVAQKAGEYLAPEQLVVHGTKGLELRTHKRMSTILQEETCTRQFGVLAGPNIAPEIQRGEPAGTCVTTTFPRVFELARDVLASRRLMVFPGGDVPGVELCSALKNVVAIAAGMAAGLGLGENAKAFLVTRGMTEIARIGLALGAQRATFRGLAGIGDLVVTCASPQSRNHRIGAAIARGERLEDALARLGMVAEGVPAAIAARELAVATGIDAPLLERVHRVLHERLPVERALDELMGMAPTLE